MILIQYNFKIIYKNLVKLYIDMEKLRDKLKFSYSGFKHKGVIHIIPSIHVVVELLLNVSVLTFDFVFIQRTFYVSIYLYFKPKL